MPEERHDIPLPDQGPRREGPAHREEQSGPRHRVDNPKADTTSRRTVLHGLFGLAAGAFGVGAPAYTVGIAKGEEAGYQDAQEGQKVFVKPKEGKPSGIIEAEIINTPHQKLLTPESSVKLEPSIEVPALFTDANTDITITKALTDEEVTKAMKPDVSPKDQLTILTSAKSDKEQEETTVFEVVLPKGETNCSTFFNLTDNDTCYVIPRTGDPVSCGLYNDQTVKEDQDSGKYRFGVSSEKPFPSGSSVYVVVNTRMPPPKPVEV